MHRRRVLHWLTSSVITGTVTTASDLSIAAQPARAAVDDVLVAALRRGGHFVLMRHAATEPGIGDPAGFVLGTCATQRNLSASGRDDAVRTGAAFRHLGIPVDTVMSSRWCRCLDTARLAFGQAVPSPMLDSMFNDDAPERAAKLQEVAAWTQTPRGRGNVVLVTHDVNIQALAQRAVRQGEMVVTSARADGGLDVVGTLWL